MSLGLIFIMDSGRMICLMDRGDWEMLILHLVIILTIEILSICRSSGSFIMDCFLIIKCMEWGHLLCVIMISLLGSLLGGKYMVKGFIIQIKEMLLKGFGRIRSWYLWQ